MDKESIEEDIANIERTLARTMELLAERGYNVANNPIPTMALIAAGMCFSPYVLGGLLVADLLIHHRELWQSSKEFAHLLCTDTPEVVAHFFAFCIEMALLHKTTTTLQGVGHEAIEAAMLRIRPVLNQLAACASQEKVLALASNGALDLAAMPHSELVEGMKDAVKAMREDGGITGKPTGTNGTSLIGKALNKEEIWDIVEYAKKYKGGAKSGYKGGAKFDNNGRQGGQLLPQIDSTGQAITYKEYDIMPMQKNRGLERIVIGNDDRVYYTSDHYQTFKEIKK